MKKREIHSKDIDQYLNQKLINTYEPSAGFVDDVMRKVADIDIIQPASRYIKVLFQVAAAVAIAVFITNIFILVTSTQNTTESTNDWTSVYELGTSTNWYEYYDNETYIANNQTND